MKHKLFLFHFLLTLLLLGSTLSCNSQNSKLSLSELREDSLYQEMQKEANEVNANCPVAINDWAKMMSFTLNDREIKMEMQISPKLKQMQKMMERKDLLTYLTSNAIMERYPLQVFKELQRMDITFHIVYKTQMDGKNLVDFKITPSDFEKAYNQPKDWKYYDHSLKMTMEMADLMAPTQIDEITLLTGAGKDGKIAYYKYELDDAELDFKTIEQNKDQIKASIISAINGADPTLERMALLIRKTDAVLRYIYKSKTTDDEFSIDITTKDLEEDQYEE